MGGDRAVGVLLLIAFAVVVGWRLVDLGQGVRAGVTAEARSTARQTADLLHCIQDQVARVPDVPSYVDQRDPDSPSPVLWYQRIIEFGFPRLDLVATRAEAQQVLSVVASDDPASCGGLIVRVQPP